MLVLPCASSRAKRPGRAREEERTGAADGGQTKGAERRGRAAESCPNRGKKPGGRACFHVGSFVLACDNDRKLQSRGRNRPVGGHSLATASRMRVDAHACQSRLCRFAEAHRDDRAPAFRLPPLRGRGRRAAAAAALRTACSFCPASARAEPLRPSTRAFSATAWTVGAAACAWSVGAAAAAGTVGAAAAAGTVGAAATAGTVGSAAAAASAWSAWFWRERRVQDEHRDPCRT